jgi:hypothetical protein
MVRCDLCGASPSGTDAEAGADGGASPSGSGAEASRGASPTGASAHAGVDAVDSDATVPLGWVVSVEAGRTRTYCEMCAREHLRSIEAKLDSEWW